MGWKIFLGILGTSLFLLSCSHTTSSDGFLTNMPRLERVIDAHVHLPEANDPDDPHRYDGFIAAKVVGAVAHASRGNPVPPRLRNVPMKYASCAAIAETITVPEVEKGLKDGTCQCLKVYLGYVKRYAYDPFYRPFYALAEKYNVPVVFHTGDTEAKDGKVKYSDPLTIDEVAVDFPKVNFLIAHMGNPWIQSAAEVVYKNDNVYVDTSALMIGDLTKKSREAVNELVTKQIHWFYLYVENPKKILFGTDWPLTAVGPYLEAVQRAIPKEHWDDVFYGNAARLFQMK